PLGTSVRARLALIQAILVAALVVISIIAWHALNHEVTSGRALATLSRVERHHMSAENMVEALRADANAALGVHAADSAAAGEALASLRADARLFEEDLQTVADAGVQPDIERELTHARTLSKSYIELANQLVTTAIRDNAAASALEPQFSAAFDE